MTDKQIICKCNDKECGQCSFEEQLKRSEAQCEAMFVTHTDLEKKYKAKEQECEELKDKLNCCFCNPYVELHDIQKQRKCVEVTECFRRQLDQLKAENRILKEKFEIAIKNNMDKTLLRLENGDVKEELQEIREEFGIETLYCHDDNTRVHRCLDVLRLKDTLTEIKEIAKGVKVYDPLAKRILQKISEVENV